jgi:hypothetical protein
MGGGLMQLVAHGAQDVYLTGNADITFFKVVYRRHTNFAVEAIQQTFNGTADFGRKVSVTVSRNADLITRAYVQVTLPEVLSPTGGFAWVEEVGHYLLSNVQVEIGGQCIDRHYGEWLSIWNSLTLPVGQDAGYDRMIGNEAAFYGTATSTAGLIAAGVTIPARTLYIPLQFWFNRNAGLALPLIALQYHEVKISVDFAPLSGLFRGTAPVATPVLSDASLYIDYVYLARDERRRFAQSAHEYLIEQLQFQGSDSLGTGLNHKIRLNLNHPVKELVWVVQRDDAVVAGDEFQPNNFTTLTDATGENNVAAALIQLNGHERFSERSGTYFNVVQPFQHHTRSPAVGINTYSFCEKPEEHQPTGSANFSRIDNANLCLTLAAAGSASRTVRVYAVNYNVLRIMSGMGGLAFAN